MGSSQYFGSEHAPSFWPRRRHFPGPYQQHHFGVCWLLLIDDTDLVTSIEPDTPVTIVTQRMQASMDAWEGGIRGTGGAIVPEKSFWYFVLDFNGNRRITLRHLEPHTLGGRLAPDGKNNLAELEFLRHEAARWAGDLTHTGHLLLSNTSTISRKLHYPLPATTFSPCDIPPLRFAVRSEGVPVSRYRKLPGRSVRGNLCRFVPANTEALPPMPTNPRPLFPAEATTR